MRMAYRTLTTLAAIVALAATGSAEPEEGRGRDIHFRGPVFVVSRDADENVVQLTVRVNQSQIDVQVTAWTEVIQGRGFRSERNDLALGDFIQVGGFFTSRGRIMARRIHVENRDDLELEGRVELISGNLVRVGGIDFLVESESVLRASGSRAPVALSGLAQGMPVRVRASEDGGLWRIRELEFGERTVASEPLRFEGIVHRIHAGGDYLEIDVGIRLDREVMAVVYIDSGTSVSGTLRAGVLVEIEGRFEPNAAVRAERIAVDGNRNQNVFEDDDETGPAATVELEGRVRDLRRGGGGSQFRLNETVIRLDGQTRLHWRHGESATEGDLVEGLPVWVEGRPLQDRSVVASRIELRPEVGEDPGNGDSNGESNDGDSGEDVGEERPPDEGDSDDFGEGDSQDGNGLDTEQGGTGQAVRLTGPIESLGRQPDGSVHLIAVAGTPVHVTSRTVILNLVVSPGVVTSVSLNVGQEVVIVGVWRDDDSVRAETIEILTG
jgi:hypothetical protein